VSKSFFLMSLLAGLVVFASVPLPLLALYFHPVLSCHAIVSFYQAFWRFLLCFFPYHRV